MLSWVSDRFLPDVEGMHDMAEETCDVLIAGAGVIGVAIARELRRRYGVKVVVLEKESTAGRHASGRNSGVLLDRKSVV